MTILTLLVKYLILFHADPCNKSYISGLDTGFFARGGGGGGGTYHRLHTLGCDIDCMIVYDECEQLVPKAAEKTEYQKALDSRGASQMDQPRIFTGDEYTVTTLQFEFVCSAVQIFKISSKLRLSFQAPQLLSS